MKLEDVFIQRPELVNDPEVKLLISYYEREGIDVMKANYKLEKLLKRIVKEALKSEIMRIGGTDSKKAIANIIRIYSDER